MLCGVPATCFRALWKQSMTPSVKLNPLKNPHSPHLGRSLNQTHRCTSSCWANKSQALCTKGSTFISPWLSTTLCPNSSSVISCVLCESRFRRAYTVKWEDSIVLCIIAHNKSTEVWSFVYFNREAWPSWLNAAWGRWSFNSTLYKESDFGPADQYYLVLLAIYHSISATFVLRRLGLPQFSSRIFLDWIHFLLRPFTASEHWIADRHWS